MRDNALCLENPVLYIWNFIYSGRIYVEINIVRPLHVELNIIRSYICGYHCSFPHVCFLCARQCFYLQGNFLVVRKFCHMEGKEKEMKIVRKKEGNENCTEKEGNFEMSKELKRDSRNKLWMTVSAS